MSFTMELRKFVAPEIITGLDARLIVGRYIAHFASKKPMVVTDKNLLDMPWFSGILQSVAKNCDKYVLFNNITSNPRDSEVMMGASLFLAEKCDLIIAVGGGSPIDCAKGISIVSTNGGDILDYEGVDEINLPGPPLICIPSTAGASADVSQFAIIRDSEHLLKKAIISKKAVPDLALVDPVPLMTMDRNLTACTGMDALTHAIEAYVSNAHSQLTNVHALESIHLINTSIEAALDSGRSIETMYQMMLGSLHAGLAFSNASLGAVHAMAHSLGGMLDLPHGECNSILLEHVIGLNFDSAVDKYKDIASKMDLDVLEADDAQVKELLTGHIKELRMRLGIKDHAIIDTLNDSPLDRLADGALSDPCLVTNPRPITREEVKNIYGRILKEKK